MALSGEGQSVWDTAGSLEEQEFCEGKVRGDPACSPVPCLWTECSEWVDITHNAAGQVLLAEQSMHLGKRMSQMFSNDPDVQQ